MEPSSPPVLHREARSGVRLGLQRGGSLFFVIINPSPSPIQWCSPPGVSNSFIGLLVGEELDEIHHVIEVVLLGPIPSIHYVLRLMLLWLSMLNACHFGTGCHDFRSEPFMPSPLYSCSRSNLVSYSHLLRVMIRQPWSDNSRDHSRWWP